MIGLIVSSMPSLPAFVRHLRGGVSSTSISFDLLAKRSSKKSAKPDRGPGGGGMGLDDPSFLHSVNNGYEELTDLEGQKGMQTKREDLEGSMNNMTTATVGDRGR